MKNNNRNSLKEIVRTLVIKYEVEKELERNKEIIEKEVDKIARKLAENMVNNILSIYFEMDENEKKDCIEMLAQKVKEDFAEEYIYRKVVNMWCSKERLEEGEKEIEKILYETISMFKKGKEIAEVRERIINELTKIAEKEGINKLKKNLEELLCSAIRKVLPTPEDYRSFREKEIKYFREYIEKVVKNIYLEFCKCIGVYVDEQDHSMFTNFIKALYHQDIDKEIKEIYGNNKGKNMWGLYTDIGYI